MSEKNFTIIKSFRSNASDLPNEESIANSSKKYVYNNKNHFIIQEFKDNKQFILLQMKIYLLKK